MQNGRAHSSSSPKGPQPQQLLWGRLWTTEYSRRLTDEVNEWLQKAGKVKRSPFPFCALSLSLPFPLSRYLDSHFLNGYNAKEREVSPSDRGRQLTELPRTYMTALQDGGKGSPKSRWNEQNWPISVCDKGIGIGGPKNAKLLRMSYKYGHQPTDLGAHAPLWDWDGDGVQ